MLTHQEPNELSLYLLQRSSAFGTSSLDGCLSFLSCLIFGLSHPPSIQHGSYFTWLSTTIAAAAAAAAAATLSVFLVVPIPVSPVPGSRLV